MRRIGLQKLDNPYKIQHILHQSIKESLQISLNQERENPLKYLFPTSMAITVNGGHFIICSFA